MSRWKSSWLCCRCMPVRVRPRRVRRRGVSASCRLGQVAADDRFDLSTRDSIVLTGLNQRGAGLVERGLRCEQVEQRRSAKSIPLLLYAKVFLSGSDRGLLNDDPFFRRMQPTELLNQVLLRR